MKKIFLTLLMTGALISSCDMDVKPYGALDDTTAIQSLNDCYRFRNGLYNSLKGMTTGSYVYITDLQADEFQATVSYGNRNGIVHAGTFTSAEGTFESYWSSFYSVITSANYIIEKMDNLRNNSSFNEDELIELDRYEAEAKFIRAYSYFSLIQRFCEPYTTEIGATEAKGLPIVKTYDPTGDITKYPGRSSQDDTYSFINEDLTDAYDGLAKFEAKNKEYLAPEAIYLSTNAVKALQARIALYKGDNATALSKSEEIINSGIYRLAEISEFKQMWKEDKTNEAILKIHMTNTELGNSTGGAYLGTKLNSADYIPSYETISMYAENDIRSQVYFDTWNLSVEGGTFSTVVFNKYPGNDELKTGSDPNFVNMSKPFRLAEIYLIAAEAASTTDESKANKYLNDLREKRIEGYQRTTYSGQALINEIRTERQKELLGEGFRLSDLNRWGLGFQRGVSHPENPDVESILAVNGKGLSYSAEDYRYVWPIPSAEMQTNPQLKGQQNKGY